MKVWKIVEKDTSLVEVVEIAKKLSAWKKAWHFHVLAPGCKLHEGGDFALILENTEDHDLYFAHSDAKPVEVGKELVQLLHGQEVMKEETIDTAYRPTAAITHMVARAKQLNAQGKPWHHHMLFPDCKFNDSRQWKITFEGSDGTDDLFSMSVAEPKEDLKQIETLFYQGKS